MGAGVWYPGVLTKFDARSRKYSVEFDDGEVQVWLSDAVPAAGPRACAPCPGCRACTRMGLTPGSRAVCERSDTDSVIKETRTVKLAPCKRLCRQLLPTVARMTRLLVLPMPLPPRPLTPCRRRAASFRYHEQETKIPDKDVEVVVGRKSGSSKKGAAKRAHAETR